MNLPLHTLVVGGTRGIGRVVARRFAADGHAVSAVGRRSPSSPAAGVRDWPADVTDPESLGETLDEILAESGKLASLVLVQRFRGEDDPWQGELDVSVTATRGLIERLQDSFAERPNGAIAIVSSNASRLVADEQSVGYHAAKAALRQMTRYYAVALGPRGIRVNCVSPGSVLKDESSPLLRTNEPLLELYRRTTPLGRMGRPEDVADAIAFLCSPQASFITGVDLVVDGGLSLLWQESLIRAAADPTGTTPAPADE